MRGTHRFTFSATQTIFDRVGNGADVGLFQDQRFRSKQAKAGRVRTCHITAGKQLACIEAALGINPLFVVAKRLDFLRCQVFKLGNADAVFAGNDAIQFSGECHDARHRRICLLQHGVVVGIHRNVSVDIAVAGVHVQCNEYAAVQHFLVDRIEFFLHLDEHAP